MRNRRFVLGSVSLVLFAALAVIGWKPAPVTPTMAASIAADKWVASNMDLLPTDFVSYVALSYPYRRAAYRALSWPVREKLWRTHVESFLLPPESLSTAQLATAARVDGRLSPRQKGILRVFLDSVVPFAYEPGLTPEQRIAIAEPICKRAEALLGGRKAMLLGKLGPVDYAWEAFRQATASQRFARPAVMGLAIPGASELKSVILSQLARIGFVNDAVSCDCHVSSACDCPSGRYCVNSNCDPVPGACGCGDFFVCDGSECDDPF